MSFGIKIGAGEKVQRMIEMTLAKESVSLPIFIIRGRKDGPTLAVTAGVHGTEYASIEAAFRLGKTLNPDDISGKLVILPITNMPSFKKRTIYVGPHDGKNLNRVFPGNPGGTFSEALAYQVFNELIRKADFYIDLHGGDMNEALVPCLIYAPSGNEEVDSVSVSLAESFGIDLVVKSEKAGTSYYAASHAGVPAMLAEAGGQGIWTEETVNIHVKGVKRVMGYLGMMGEKPDRHPVKVFPFPWLFSEHDGLFYPQVTVGDKIVEGQKVGSVCDYFRTELQVVLSPTNGTILFLVTSLAINRGDPLMGIGG
jgi:hypothetical protein